MKRAIIVAFFLGMICLNAGAVEDATGSVADSESIASSSDYSDSLLGDWGGKRGTMSAHGYDWGIVYKLDLVGNTSSPNKEIYVLDNLDIKLSLDGERIAGYQGTSAFLYILSNRGGKPAVESNRLPHGMDNIETPYDADTTKLYQAWVQQTLLDNRVSVLAGLYDLNSEFYANESAAMFIHPTFGIGAEMAGTGKNGPSIFPTTSFAIRVKVQPAPGYFLQAATLDGVPGDPNNSHGTHVQFNKGDGTLNVVQGEIPLGLPVDAHDNKLALGLWRYTSRFDDQLDVDANGNLIPRISHGVYATLEKVLSYKPDSHEESIRSFIRWGKNDGNTIQFDMAWSAGLVFEGALPGREQDELGIAIAQERNGTKYRVASGSSIPHEKSLELGYRYHALPGLVLQPVVQYLINHSTQQDQDRTWWLGIRFEASL